MLTFPQTLTFLGKGVLAGHRNLVLSGLSWLQSFGCGILIHELKKCQYLCLGDDADFSRYEHALTLDNVSEILDVS